MQSASRNKSYYSKKQGGRPNVGAGIFRTLNEPLDDKNKMQSLKDKVKKLTDPEGVYKMTFEVLSSLTGNVVSKPYLSLIAKGNHLNKIHTITPRKVHAFAIDLIYATALQTKGKQGELENAMKGLESELALVLRSVKRITKLRRIK